MSPAATLPLSVRLRAAGRAAMSCLRGDYTVQRIPVRAADRRPMCSTLAQCCQTTAELDRAETQLAELRDKVRVLRSRLAHPSNPERSS